MRAQQQCVPQSALPGPCGHARPVSCKAQPLTGFVLVFPRGNAPTTLWFSRPPAFGVRGLGLVLVLVLIERALIAGATLRVVLVVLLDISKVGGGAQSRAHNVCEVRIRLRIWTERISHAEALISMSEAVVNSSPLLVRCVFVSDSSIFVTNIFSLILGNFVAMIAADFLGHTDPKTTQSYYNKAGNTQRLALAQPLASTLDKNFKPDSLLNLSE